jgi:hypothetical protein
VKDVTVTFTPSEADAILKALDAQSYADVATGRRDRPKSPMETAERKVLDAVRTATSDDGIWSRATETMHKKGRKRSA